MSTSERKAHALKRDLSDIKNSMSEINNLAVMGRTQGVGDMKLSNTTTMNQLTEKFVKNEIKNFQVFINFSILEYDRSKI